MKRWLPKMNSFVGFHINRFSSIEHLGLYQIYEFAILTSYKTSWEVISPLTPDLERFMIEH